MKIEMIIERTKTGYSAYAVKYPVFTTGKTLEQLKANMLEALNLNFEEEGKTVTLEDIYVNLEGFEPSVP